MTSCQTLHSSVLGRRTQLARRLACPAPAQKVPGWHCDSRNAPSFAKSVHAIPAGTGEMLPGAHVRHASKPLVFLYVLASQGTHAPSGPVYPGPHGTTICTNCAFSVPIETYIQSEHTNTCNAHNRVHCIFDGLCELPNTHLQFLRTLAHATPSWFCICSLSSTCCQWWGTCNSTGTAY